MPRGNDADAAMRDLKSRLPHELADQFGKGVGNAEELIEANQRAVGQEFRRAELLPRDEKGTAELQSRLHELDAPDGCKVVAAAKRGPLITIVYEDETGRHRLGVLDEDEKVIDAPEPVGEPARPNAADEAAGKSSRRRSAR